MGAPLTSNAAFALLDKLQAQGAAVETVWSKQKRVMRFRNIDTGEEGGKVNQAVFHALQTRSMIRRTLDEQEGETFITRWVITSTGRQALAGREAAS